MGAGELLIGRRSIAPADAAVQTHWKPVLALSLGFGLVGLDRFMILPMFPVMARELDLGPADLGLITGALSIAWGASALVAGGMADRLGRRKILILAMIAFSLLVGISGLAQGLFTLIVIRAFMGFAEGAYVAPGIAATTELTHPRHRGLTLGLQQMAISVFGLFLAPLFVTIMMHMVDWRWVFATVAIPGFLLASILGRSFDSVPGNHRPAANEPRGLSFGRMPVFLLKHRNVPQAIIIMIGGLAMLVTIVSLAPSYLTTSLELDFLTMGRILSGSGLGAMLGAVAMLTLSDLIGRRKAAMISALGALASILLLGLTGPSPVLLFLELFAISFFSIALVALADGPIAVEAVPGALAAGASGLVIAAGEIIGGGLGPIAAGGLAERFGLAVIFPFSAALALVAFAASFQLRGPSEQE